AARLARSEKEQAPRTCGAIAPVVHERSRGPAAILATQILRLQRVQRQKETRETRIHARESGDTRAGATSEGLALEQFLLLHERRDRVAGDRSGASRNPR